MKRKKNNKLPAEMNSKATVTMKAAAAIVLCIVLSSVSLQAYNIGWVSLHPGDNIPSTAAAGAGFTQAPDVGYTTLLAANGYNVTRYVTMNMPTPSFIAQLNTNDLVIISRSVPSAHYGDPAAEVTAELSAWHGVTAPMMILGGYVNRANRLALWTGNTIPDVSSAQVRLTVLNPAHPIFAGIALDGANTMVNPYAQLVTLPDPIGHQRGISVVTDPIALGGTVLATVGTSGDAALGGAIIAEFPAGITIFRTNNFVLANRRVVFLTGSRERSGLTAEGAGIYDLLPDGQQMFLNAVLYTIPEPGPLALLGGGLALVILRRLRRRSG